jgi:hypothetical protein
MSGEALEKYAVQFFSKDKWIERSTYTVEERHDALQEAKIMGRRLGDTPIRVLLDRFNPLSRVHTQTLIFRNEVKEPSEQRLARLQGLEAQFAHRTPVSIIGYLGLMLNVVLIGVVAAGLSALLIELMMQGFQVPFPPEFHDVFLTLIFGLVFLISSYSSFQNYQQKYVFAGWQKKSPKSKSSTLTAVQKLEKRQAAKETADMTRIMKKAASDIDKVSHMPYDENDDEVDDLARYYFPVADAIEEEVRVKDTASYKVFFSTFLSDCLHGIQEHNMMISGRNRFGLQIYMKAAIDQIVDRNMLSKGFQEQLQAQIFGLLDLKGEEQAEFLQNYVSYAVTSPHQELIAKAKQIVIYADAGESNGALDMFMDLDLWAQALKEEEEKPVFVLSCEPLGEVEVVKKEAFNLFAQNLFTLHKAIVYEHPRAGWLVQFANRDEVCAVSIELQKYCEDQENQIAPQMGLCVTNGIKNEQTFACNLSIFANPQTIVMDKNLVEQFDENTSYTFQQLGEQSLNVEEHSFELYQLDWQATPKTTLESKPKQKNDGFETLVFNAG